MQRSVRQDFDSIGIAGAGRLGQTIAKSLLERGEPVIAIASRTAERAREAAAFLDEGVQAVTYEELAARRILIAVPDDAIEDVAAQIGSTPEIALHTSGARGAAALQALRNRGTACGVLHPLQTIASAGSGASALHGSPFTVSGDAAAVAWGRQIAALMEGRVFEIDDRLRPLYHAGAVLASNSIVGMLDAAETLMISAGIPPEEALNALAPLARTTLENTLRLGPVAALTGPIQRGDAATIAAHLKSLAAAPDRLRQLYLASARATLELARRRGLPQERAAAIENVLR